MAVGYFLKNSYFRKCLSSKFVVKHPLSILLSSNGIFLLQWNGNSRLTSPRPLDVLYENNNLKSATKWFHTAEGFHYDFIDR